MFCKPLVPCNKYLGMFIWAYWDTCIQDTLAFVARVMNLPWPV